MRATHTHPSKYIYIYIYMYMHVRAPGALRAAVLDRPLAPVSGDALPSAATVPRHQGELSREQALEARKFCTHKCKTGCSRCMGEWFVPKRFYKSRVKSENKEVAGSKKVKKEVKDATQSQALLGPVPVEASQSAVEPVQVVHDSPVPVEASQGAVEPVQVVDASAVAVAAVVEDSAAAMEPVLAVLEDSVFAVEPVFDESIFEDGDAEYSAGAADLSQPIFEAESFCL